MKQALAFLVALLILSYASAQPSDYILLKQRNNRTLKTYYPGSFISAITYDGFGLNGIIIAIRNDSIIVQQHETKLVPSEFGQKIDTFRYTMGVYYNQIKKFNFVKYDVAGRKGGFAQVTIPKLLIIGGLGFMGLELINTAYRGESLTQNNKLESLSISAGAAATGFLWNFISKNRNKVGGKYRVVYVKANTGNISK